MAKKNLKQKRKVANASLLNKNAVESLSFQTHWGLKQLGVQEDHVLYEMADVEIGIVSELEMVLDLLSIKKFIDGVRQNLQVTPTPDCGDFKDSAMSWGLGIATCMELHPIDDPISWYAMKRQKMMKIYYPESKRNEVVSWAKDNGFNTSTYFGRPIVKFTNIYVIIERTRE